MNNEPIDWEAAMTQTQNAAKAASRGSERMVAAVAEMVELQHVNAIELRKAREAIVKSHADLEIIKSAQCHLSKTIQSQAQENQQSPHLWQRCPTLIAVGLGFVACVALFANW